MYVLKMSTKYFRIIWKFWHLLGHYNIVELTVECNKPVWIFLMHVGSFSPHKKINDFFTESPDVWWRVWFLSSSQFSLFHFSYTFMKTHAYGQCGSYALDLALLRGLFGNTCIHVLWKSFVYVSNAYIYIAVVFPPQTYTRCIIREASYSHIQWTKLL